MGVHFFAQKVDDLFSRRPQRPCPNIPPNLSHQAKTVLKLTLALAEGAALRVLGVHLHIFPVN